VNVKEIEAVLAAGPGHVRELQEANTHAARKLADARAVVDAAATSLRFRPPNEHADALALLDAAEALGKEADAELKAAQERCAAYLAELELLRRHVDGRSR